MGTGLHARKSIGEAVADGGHDRSQAETVTIVLQPGGGQVTALLVKAGHGGAAKKVAGE